MSKKPTKNSLSSKKVIRCANINGGKSSIWGKELPHMPHLSL